MHFNERYPLLSAIAITLAFATIAPARALAATPVAPNAAPTTDDLKRALDAYLQRLKPTGTRTRTVLFEDVRAGKPNGPFFPFEVTATIHDYGLGYPPNRHYGQTCVGRMDRWKFDLREDAFGGWAVEGRMTVSDAVCKDNPAEGVSSMPLQGLKGTVAGTPASAPAAAPSGKAALYMGEYACYGVGSRLMAGMGFVLKTDGKYTDGDGARSGSYQYDAASATIIFRGGFLGSQRGTNVKNSSFVLSATVSCEPWR